MLPAKELSIREPFRLAYSSGNEHNPMDGTGRIALGGSRRWVHHRRERERPAASSTLECNSDRSQYRYVASELLGDLGGGLRRGCNP